MSTTPDAEITLVLGTRNRKKRRELAALIAPSCEPNPRLARLDVRLRPGAGRPHRRDPDRDRGRLPGPDHPRPLRRERLRLRSPLPDPRIPQDLRRAEPAGQAPAEPPRPRLRPAPAGDRAADRHG